MSAFADSEPREVGTDVPAVSVLMPAYNAGAYIGRAISSILEQTLANIELIVGDDQSTDNTWQIINQLAERDHRIHIFRNETNSGPAVTTNRAASFARAPLLAGMDADDISLPTRLEKQKAVLDARPEIAVLGTYVSHANDKDEVLSLSPTGPTTVAEFEDLRRKGEPTLVFGGTAMYRRELFELVGGFDGSLRAAGDLEFCDRMADHGAVIALPEPLLLYRVYSTSNVMLRFREGRRTHRYLGARRLARRNGDPLPSREGYVAAEAASPWWKKFRIWMDDASQYNYRQAGLAYAQGDKLHTGLRLVAAALTGPVHVARRVWDQRLSPRARHARRNTLQ